MSIIVDFHEENVKIKRSPDGREKVKVVTSF